VTDEPIINLMGEKVALGPLRRDLLPLYQRWVNDFEVTRTLSIPGGPLTLEAEEAWYDGASKSHNIVSFTIYERVTLRPIGTTGLMGLDHANRTAEFGILIGEKDCWGKGYGTETARLVLGYGFTIRSLHAIFLRVYSYNERGIRAYTRAGFQPAGRIREAHWYAGKPYDVLFMDCLADEFLKARGEAE
jgi:RimJ/RimL family protein N-acetyltransferase